MRFLGRSILASFLAVAVMWAMWLAKTPDPEFWAVFGTLILGPVIFNMVPDYLSLVESRWILAKMRGRGVRATTTLLLLDAVLTALIFYVFVSVAIIILQAVLEPDQANSIDPLQVWTLLTTGGRPDTGA